MRTACIVQARQGSKRLPGKSMMDIAGKPMLQRVLERVNRIEGIDVTIVATSYRKEDTVIADLCRSLSTACYRGDATNVLDRYMNAATIYSVDNVMRITADCPLLDPVVCSDVLRLFNLGHWDYVSNTQPPTFPDGLDCECFTVATLESAWRHATEASDFEHVTPYIYRRPSPFKLQTVWADADYSKFKWSVDTAMELNFARQVYVDLGEQFTWREVFEYSIL